MATYKTLLVPFDGSPLAEYAIPYASSLARAARCQLVVIQAVRDVVARHHAETELAALAERLWQAGLLVETHVRIGNPGDVIVAAARSWAADLIVMSTHGRSGLGRWLYGSTADFVLRHSPVPVLLIPATCEQRWHLTGGDRARVLVPLDGSDLAQEALDVASEFARNVLAEIILLRVVPLPVYPYGEGYSLMMYDMTEEVAAARDWLEQVATTLRGQGYTVETLAEVGTPAAVIADVARERQVSVIVMATHGRSGLARVVLGSVATGALHLARRPVLLVRPTALSAGGQGAQEPAPATEQANQ